MTRKGWLIPRLSCAISLANAQEFQSLFNGNDLTGWAGRTKLWSVKDGVILGRTTAENPLKAQGNDLSVFAKRDLRRARKRVLLRLSGTTCFLARRQLGRSRNANTLE